MTKTSPKKWVVRLQPVQGGEVRHIPFDWIGTPTLEDSAGMAMARLEQTLLVTTPVPKGDASPQQTALKGCGYEIVGLNEAPPVA